MTSGNIGCTVGETDGESQTIQNYVNALGFVAGATATGTVTSGTTAGVKWNNETRISMDYHTTGLMNETAGNYTIGEAQAYGTGYNISTDTVYFTDPDTIQPAVGNTSTSSTFTRAVGADSTQYLNLSNGGSYTSTSGMDLQVAVGPTWGGVGPSLNTVGLVDTTSATQDTSLTVDCVLQDLSSTYSYEFTITVDSTLSTALDAINVHIWYDYEFT